MRFKDRVIRKKEDRRPLTIFKLILIVWGVIFVIALLRRLIDIIQN